jgi:hypothetical protein
LNLEKILLKFLDVNLRQLLDVVTLILNEEVDHQNPSKLKLDDFQDSKANRMDVEPTYLNLGFLGAVSLSLTFEINFEYHSF